MGYSVAMQKYGVFEGRATRAEFWLFHLIAALLTIAAIFLDVVVFKFTVDKTGPLQAVVTLGHIAPSLAVSARRLHDANFSAWWLLLLITVVGVLVLAVLWLLPGTRGANRFGAQPTNEDPALAQPAPRPAAPANARPADKPRDIVDELERLAALRASGSLSEAEYASLKAETIGSGS